MTNAEDETEGTLVERAKADPRAFGALYDRYVLRVYRAALRSTHDHQAAEDITAQTFRKALEGLAAYRWQGAPFGAWLHRISANLTADHFHRLSRRAHLDRAGGGLASAPEADPVEVFLAVESRTELWQAVTRLTPLHRRVLTLRYGQGLSTREVSRILNRSEPATKQLVYRALQDLRRILGPHEAQKEEP